MATTSPKKKVTFDLTPTVIESHYSLKKKVMFDLNPTVIEIPSHMVTEYEQPHIVGKCLELLWNLVLMGIGTIFSIVAPFFFIIMVFKVCILYISTARAILGTILEIIDAIFF